MKTPTVSPLAGPARWISTPTCMMCVLMLFALVWMLFDHEGVRLWENPLETAGGIVGAFAAFVVAFIVTVRVFRDRLRPLRAIAVSLVLTLLVTGGAFLILDLTSTAYAPTFELYRDEWVVCRGEVSEGCALGAAARLDARIAWVRDTSDVQTSQVVAVPEKEIAIQNLTSDETVISISSGALSNPPRGRSEQLKVGKYRVTMWREPGSLDARWRSHSQLYGIEMSSFDSDELIARDVAIRLISRIRFALPPPQVVDANADDLGV